MEMRTIRVRGSAKVWKAPDWVVIRFSISSIKPEYEKCMEQLAVYTENLRQELNTVGLGPENLKTTDFDIDTYYETVKSKSVFKGYEASHDLTVEFPFTKDYLNKVLRALSKTKSGASFRVSFTVKDPEPMRQQALAEAIKNSRDKAQILAETAGVSLGKILQIDYSWSEVHIRPSLALSNEIAPMAAPEFDFTPSDVNVSDSVSVIWAIK